MLHPTENSYHGRKSINHEYWHERIHHIRIDDLVTNSSGKKPIILGCCSDTGVKRNGGRVGAKLGPAAIRKALGPLAYHARFSEIIDLGNIIEEQENLEKAHDDLYGALRTLLDKHYFPILLGGGHDLAYPHGKAILDHCSTTGEKVGIINLDAHFDLRPLNEGIRHSGSPFHQLAEEYPVSFHYLCLGLQQASNPRSLFEFASKHLVEWIEMESFQLTKWDYIQEYLNTFCRDKNKIYLTIDLDGFSSAYAPGVSAPSPLGFDPLIIQCIIKWLVESRKLIAVDFVELNPVFDVDEKTAKLAARLIEHLVRNL